MAIVKRVSFGREGINNVLYRHAANVHSQAGEDGVIEAIFRVISEKSRWCCEFGAWDGKHLSNSWRLIAERGWNAVLIEGKEERFADLLAASADRPIHPLQGYVGFGETDGLDTFLARTPIPRDFDFLSIDVDGIDIHIFEAMTVYRPRVVCIEFNPSIPPDIIYVQDRDMSVQQGSSLLAITILARRKGYELVATTSLNAFFVLREEFHLFGIADNSVDTMRVPSAYHERSCFSLYDGTVVTVGTPMQIWNRPKQVFTDPTNAIGVEPDGTVWFHGVLTGEPRRGDG